MRPRFDRMGDEDRRELARIPVREPFASSGGGAQIIRAQITAEPDCDAGTAEDFLVTAIQCGGVEGASLGGTVTLTDPMDFLTGNPALLVNHQFFAVRMQSAAPYGDECEWEIFQSDDLGFNC